jgi:hypothetical protein
MGSGKLAPGKASAADDANDLSMQDLRRPGKGTLVTSSIKDGAVCDRAPSADGCSLEPLQRMRVVGELNSRIQFAERECGDALRVVQFQTMIRRPAELPLVIGVLIDLGLGHVSTMIGSAIKGLRERGLARLDELALEAGAAGTFDGGSPKIEAMLRGLTDTRIDATMKMVSGGSRAAATAKWKHLRNADEATAQERQIDYLEVLRTEMMLGFEAFRQRAPLGANDVELFALLESFDKEKHVSPLYQTAMRAKLTRFEELGLEKVGRHFARSEDDHPIERDLRLVWVRSKNKLAPPYLAFQQSDGIRGGTLPETRAAPTSFGAENPYGNPALSGRRVPDEFVSLAIDRHRAVWGDEPPEVVVDDTPPGLPRTQLGAGPPPGVPPLPPNFDYVGALTGKKGSP